MSAQTKRERLGLSGSRVCGPSVAFLRAARRRGKNHRECDLLRRSCPRKRTPRCPEGRRALAGQVRIDSRALPATLRAVGSKLAEGLLAVNGIAALNVV